MPSYTSGHSTFRYWWVDKGQFLAGQTPASYESFPSKQFIKHLLELGIRTFISLQEEDEVSRKDFAFYHDALERLSEDMNVETSFIRLPAMDGSTLNDSQISMLLDLIDSSLNGNKPVYLHCMAGHGRTGTVVGCWLARHGCAGGDALKRLVELRSEDEHFATRPCPQKPGQVSKVRSWPKGK